MKIAILLAGPMRSLPEVIANHKRTIGEYDTYVSCRQEDYNDWVNSDWNPTAIYITPEVDFQQTDWYAALKHKNEHNVWLLERLYLQHWGISNCIKNMPKGYDYYIKSRNDMVYEFPLELNFESIKDNEIWCPDTTFWGFKWRDNGFFNDQLWICKENTLEIASRFVTDVCTMADFPGNNIRKELFENLITETANVLFLDNAGIKHKKFTYPYTKNHFGQITGSCIK